ncbi:nucleoside ABC transporter membrane protein [Dongia mobilis]|uniref:Nucleoside ABC transporter membrane protein n=1 Tax=Dongia mobilis TaxID=578943 RepID=A0A4R6WUL0_9PROT|nr:ABC transporter permease [Dongia mobilis]TDQ80628.1 nucleoside ABC transporter membrane protein [Dongia mobilis]
MSASADIDLTAAEQERQERRREILAAVLRVLIPVMAALVMGGIILLILGKNPLDYYGFVLRRGLLTWGGLQETLTRMAPLLLIGAGLIVAFRAGIWNLGTDGQFLIAAVLSAALAPALITVLPDALTIIICMVVSMLAAAIWSLIPAILKARYGINEIITSLMMSFLGVSFANVLVKLFFRDPATTVPQTMSLAVEDRLPRLFDTTIHLGLIIALVVIVLVHVMMTRTAFGLKLQVVGANPAAAVHAGLRVGWLTIATFAISAGLIGLGGAVEILGVWGVVRADWNPAFGLLVVPLVFLARFNGYATIGFTLFFSALMIGGDSAARRVGVPNDFVLVLVALLLIFLAVVEYLDHLRRKKAGA